MNYHINDLTQIHTHTHTLHTSLLTFQGMLFYFIYIKNYSPKTSHLIHCISKVINSPGFIPDLRSNFILLYFFLKESTEVQSLTVYKMLSNTPTFLCLPQ